MTAERVKVGGNRPQARVRNRARPVKEGPPNLGWPQGNQGHGRVRARGEVEKPRRDVWPGGYGQRRPRGRRQSGGVGGKVR